MNKETIYRFTLKDHLNIPLDVRSIRPDKFIGLSKKDILSMKIHEGNTIRYIEDLFDVEMPSKPMKNMENIKIVFFGETLDKLYYLGFKMKGGIIEVHGDVGPLTGYKMKNGLIKIYGSARSWLGAKMINGHIEVYGDVEDFIGSKLMGEKPGKGMKGGIIIIHGSAGSNIGNGMKNGSIIIEGKAGNLVGYDMVGGSILIKNGCGKFLGSRIRSGKIVVNGNVDGIIPSLYIDSIVGKAKVKKYIFEKEFVLFIGDALVNGNGRIYISYKENVELLKEYINLISEVNYEFDK